jgi:hypothetical protein
MPAAGRMVTTPRGAAKGVRPLAETPLEDRRRGVVNVFLFRPGCTPWAAGVRRHRITDAPRRRAEFPPLHAVSGEPGTVRGGRKTRRRCRALSGDATPHRHSDDTPQSSYPTDETRGLPRWIHTARAASAHSIRVTRARLCPTAAACTGFAAPPGTGRFAGSAAARGLDRGLTVLAEDIVAELSSVGETASRESDGRPVHAAEQG